MLYLHVIDVAARGFKPVPWGIEHLNGLWVSYLPKHVIWGVHPLSRGKHGSFWIGGLEIHGVQLGGHVILVVFPIFLLQNIMAFTLYNINKTSKILHQTFFSYCCPIKISICMYPFSNIVICNKYCWDTIEKFCSNWRYQMQHTDTAVQLNTYTCKYAKMRTAVGLPGGHNIG